MKRPREDGGEEDFPPSSLEGLDGATASLVPISESSVEESDPSNPELKIRKIAEEVQQPSSEALSTIETAPLTEQVDPSSVTLQSPENTISSVEIPSTTHQTISLPQENPSSSIENAFQEDSFKISTNSSNPINLPSNYSTPFPPMNEIDSSVPKETIPSMSNFQTEQTESNTGNQPYHSQVESLPSYHHSLPIHMNVSQETNVHSQTIPSISSSVQGNINLPPLSHPYVEIPAATMQGNTIHTYPATQALQTPVPAGQVVGTETQAPPVKQVKFENALDFLDQVKLQFAAEPKVYNQFLDIMKDFKAQCIDTPGVIARVSELFKGHRNLILGFNTFLPPGYKIEYPEDGNALSPALPSIQVRPTSASNSMLPSPPMMQGNLLNNQMMGINSNNNAMSAAQRKQPDRDHARNYVKKVKMRFALQPHVYKSFLEILHTYHREQHTLKEVYEQVAQLFGNHPDLLEEFTQFLPDPVASYQQQGSNGSNNASSTNTTNSTSRSSKGKGSASTGNSSHARKAAAKSAERLDKMMQLEKEKDKSERAEKLAHRQAVAIAQEGTVGTSTRSTTAALAAESERSVVGRNKKNNNNNNSSAGGKDKKNEEKGSYEELNFFHRVKARMNNPTLYQEFLKCLNLFSQGIVSRVELGVLTRELLSRHRDLYDWFKNFLGFDENGISDYIERVQEEKNASGNNENESGRSNERSERGNYERTAPSRPTVNLQVRGQTDIDFKTCKRYGPSYRALPKSYTSPTCSGRTDACKSVLNDVWVSVPTGSEDHGFNVSRKNQYEEMLFKCEDDRFELDLVIESNSHTIRTLEPVWKSLSEMSAEELNRFRLDTLLDVIQLRSIERIYGEKGSEVIESLYLNPTLSIPIVLKRLRQKDQEWNRAKREWNKIWREVNEKNYYKSLDHQSFNFKQNDKKILNPKVLLAEIKQKYQEQLKEKNKKIQNNPVSMDIVESVSNGDDSMIKNSNLISTIDVVSNNNVSDSEPEDSTSDSIRYGALPPRDVLRNYDFDHPSSETPPHLRYMVSDESILHDMYEMITFNMEKSMSKMDRDRIDTFFKHFVSTFFQKRNEQDTSNNVFFANNGFYVLLRLIQLLYERLNRAKEFAQEAATQRSRSDSERSFAFLIQPKKGGPVHPTHPHHHSNDHNREEVKTEEGREMTKEVVTSPKELYKTFVKHLYDLMSGAKEQGSYEDELRVLFGIQSYVLFTLDRLISHLTKQLQSLLAEEKSSKLLALYSHTRSKSEKGSKVSVYYARCLEVLDEDRCFRFDFEKSPSFGEFTIRLLDSYHNPPQFVDAEKEKWSHYVERYLSPEEGDLDVRKHRVYLYRTHMRNNKKGLEHNSNPPTVTQVNNNQNRSKKSKQDKEQGQPSSNQGIHSHVLHDSDLKHLEIENGLECRISLKNFRLFFVENTTDFMYRKNRLKKVKKSKRYQRTKEEKTKRLEEVITNKFYNPNTSNPTINSTTPMEM